MTTAFLICADELEWQMTKNCLLSGWKCRNLSHGMKALRIGAIFTLLLLSIKISKTVNFRSDKFSLACQTPKIIGKVAHWVKKFKWMRPTFCFLNDNLIIIEKAKIKIIKICHENARWCVTMFEQLFVFEVWL